MKQNNFKQSEFEEYEEFLEFKRMKQQYEIQKNKPTSNNNRVQDSGDTERNIIGYLIVICTLLLMFFSYTDPNKPKNVDIHKSISSFHYPTKQEGREYREFIEKQSDNYSH